MVEAVIKVSAKAVLIGFQSAGRIIGWLKIGTGFDVSLPP